MTIDVHTHAIPLSILQLYRDAPGEYGFEARTEPDGALIMTGRTGIVTPLVKGMYDVPARLADMDARGVDVELVTPSPTATPNNWPLEKALPFYRLVNDGVAQMCAQAPDGRLVACGALPMQDVPAACEELERIVKAYHVPMVMVNTSVEGRFYDEPEYLPLFEACERLGVMIFFHPQHSNTSYGLGRYYLINLLGNPVDTTVSAARLVLGGVLAKYPGCKCLFAHAGGFLPYQRGRIEHGFAMRAEPRSSLGDTPPSLYFDSLYFDTITHSESALSYLISSHGANHVMLGSDYPFDMADNRHADDVLNMDGISEAERELILSGNVLDIIER